MVEVARLWFATSAALDRIAAVEDAMTWGSAAMPIFTLCADERVAARVATLGEPYAGTIVTGLPDLSGADYWHICVDPFVDYAAASARLAATTRTQPDAILADAIVKTRYRFRLSSTAGMDGPVRALLLAAPEACWLRRDHAARIAAVWDGDALALAIDAVLPPHATILRSRLLLGASLQLPRPADRSPRLNRLRHIDDPLYADCCAADILGWEIVSDVAMTAEARHHALDQACRTHFGVALEPGTLAQIARAHPARAIDDTDLTAMWRARAAALHLQVEREQIRNRRLARRVKRLEARDDPPSEPA